jgi:hypothetical protein
LHLGKPRQCCLIFVISVVNAVIYTSGVKNSIEFNLNKEPQCSPVVAIVVLVSLLFAGFTSTPRAAASPAEIDTCAQFAAKYSGPYTDGGETLFRLRGSFTLTDGQTITITLTADYQGFGGLELRPNAGDWVSLFGPDLLPQTGNYTAPSAGIYEVYGFADNDYDTGLLTITCSGSAGGDAVDHAKLCPFTDGRVNDCTAGETAAIYCTAEGDFQVYGLLNGKGFLAMVVSKAEIAAVPEYPKQNTLIKEAFGIRLYRLTSGQLQINSPASEADKPDYVFRWTNCGK